MQKFNRMVGYVRAEQDAVLVAIVYPDEGRRPEVEVAVLLIPVVQPVWEILSAELLKDFFLIVCHETGKDDIIAGKVCIHFVVKNLYGTGKIRVIVQIVRRLRRKIFISGSRSCVQCAGGHIRFPPDGQFSGLQG